MLTAQTLSHSYVLFFSQAKLREEALSARASLENALRDNLKLVKRLRGENVTDEEVQGSMKFKLEKREEDQRENKERELRVRRRERKSLLNKLENEEDFSQLLKEFRKNMRKKLARAMKNTEEKIVKKPLMMRRADLKNQEQEEEKD